MRSFWGIAFLLVLVGCSVHRPVPVELPVPVPDRYLESTAAPGEPVAQPWWHIFEDPALDRLMLQAFGANLELDQVLARWQQAEAAVRSVESARRPSLGLDGQAGRQRQMTFLGPVTADHYSLSVVAGFELDVWRKLASRSEAARREQAAAAADVEAICLSLSARLADLYYTAVEQRAQHALLENTIVSYLDILERVERRYRAGIAPALEVYQARQNLAAARARLPQVEARLAAAEHGVAVLLGRYPQGGLAGQLAVLPDPAKNYPLGVPSQLLNRRPDVKAALLRVKAADNRVAEAIAERFPAFNLAGGYGGGADTPRQVFASPNIFWNLLVNLTQPILDGGRRRAEVDRRQALFKELLASYQARVLEAFREVEDALAAERASREQVAQLQARRASTSAALRLATDRYTLGVSEYLQVLTAQVLHLETESGLLSARRQQVADRISLARALGGHWMLQQCRQSRNDSVIFPTEDSDHDK